MFDAVRCERKDERRKRRRGPDDAQEPGQPVHRDAGRDDAEQQQRVVDRRQTDTEPDGGCRRGALQERRIRQKIGIPLREEDVRVQERRTLLDRVREPREPPHAERRIDVADHMTGEHAGVRPGDERGGHRQRGGDEQILRDGRDDGDAPRTRGLNGLLESGSLDGNQRQLISYRKHHR